jgi:hypothetical protein
LGGWHEMNMSTSYHHQRVQLFFDHAFTQSTCQERREEQEKSQDVEMRQ